MEGASESYDPDGNYYEFANDDCSYYDANGNSLGNWATEWQNSHTEDVDWYQCSSAHSQSLNANRKAYAAWHLWARLAGRDRTLRCGDVPQHRPDHRLVCHCGLGPSLHAQGHR